jgi:cytoskeleton protein RodZ
MATFAPAPETRGIGGDDKAPLSRPRETVGDLLRRTRMEHGAEIDQIAAALRIRAAYLAAIEQARYDRLPGSVYALGFVRAYAIHLGLDGEEAVRRFKQEAAGLDRRRDLAFPVPLTPRSVPGGRMLLAAFVLAVCAYGIWHYLSTGDRDRPERVAAVPTELLPPQPAPFAPPADTQSSPGAADQAPTSGPAVPPAPPAPAPSLPQQGAVAPPPATVPAPLAPAAASPAPVAAAPTASPSPPSPPAPTVVMLTPLPAPPVPEPAPAPASVPPAPAEPAIAVPPAAEPAEPSGAGPHVYGAVDGPSRVTLRAVKDCWILVRDSDPAQTIVAQRTLHAGDSYRVPDRPGLVLRTGNATGLEVAVDGKVAPALGGTVRNVALDPTRLLAGTARVE